MTTNTDPVAQARKIVEEALVAFTGDRRDYGPPEDNFHCTAELWNAYLEARVRNAGDPNYCINATDHAVMMILMKVGRIGASPERRDHWVDICGYAALGGQCAVVPHEA